MALRSMTSSMIARSGLWPNGFICAGLNIRSAVSMPWNARLFDRSHPHSQRSIGPFCSGLRALAVRIRSQSLVISRLAPCGPSFTSPCVSMAASSAPDDTPQTRSTCKPSSSRRSSTPHA